MAALLARDQPGDEVVMPSFTFSSTATAFVLRGATPVFVDVARRHAEPDEALVAVAMTDHTRALVPSTTGASRCAMDALMSLPATTACT